MVDFIKHCQGPPVEHSYNSQGCWSTKTVFAILNSYKTFSLRPNPLISFLNSWTWSNLEWFLELYYPKSSSPLPAEQMWISSATPPWSNLAPRSSLLFGKETTGNEISPWLCWIKMSSKHIRYSFQGKGTIVTYFLCGKDGFDKPLPNLRDAAPLEGHEFKWCSKSNHQMFERDCGNRWKKKQRNAGFQRPANQKLTLRAFRWAYNWKVLYPRGLINKARIS